MNPPDRVSALWRYPVKSMLGEALASASVSRRGLEGDRAFAVVDAADGKTASAKDTRRWPNLFAFGAEYVARSSSATPTAILTLPGGRSVASDDPSVDEVLSRALGRAARLAALDPPAVPALHEDVELGRDATEDGTEHFFDAATVHLVTTSTLERLRELYPSGRFDVARFRPNVVVDTNGRAGFVENAWVGRTLAIGGVRLEVTAPCPRCVMTTLPQGDLPRDPGILKAVVRHNQANVGVYARVLRGGVLAQGQAVEIEDSEG